jgi:hypothetical protein
MKTTFLLFNVIENRKNKFRESCVAPLRLCFVVVSSDCVCFFLCLVNRDKSFPHF